MYLRIRLEDGDAIVFKGEPDQEDLQAICEEGTFALIKFENNSFLIAEVSINEAEGVEEEDEYEATWIKVGSA